METLEALDRWLEDDEEGVIPAELLEERGIRVSPARDIDDSCLNERLWTVIRGMADIGMFLTSTDHLSDRELYERLEAMLREETFLAPDDPMFAEHCDLVGSGSEEDIRLYLTYYAGEEERESFRCDLEALPPALPRPYDRDRLLPTHGDRVFAGMQAV